MDDRRRVGVETLLDEEREKNGRILRVKALSVPKSSEYPEGVKYRFHYGTFDGETLLRYDNSHGVHERHVGENVEEIVFTNVAELYRQFVDESAEYSLRPPQTVIHRENRNGNTYGRISG